MTSSRGADLSGSPCKRKRPRKDSPEDYLNEDDTRDSNDTSQSAADGRLGSMVAGQSTNFRNGATQEVRCSSPRVVSRPSKFRFEGYFISIADALISYIFYLENRVEQLEKLLVSHGIAFPPADDLAMSSHRDTNIDEPDPSSPGRLGTQDKVNRILSTGRKSFTSPDNKGNSPKTISRDSMGSALLNPQTAATFMALALYPTQTLTLDNRKILKYNIGGHQAFEATRCTTTSLPDRSLALKLVRAYFHRANPQIPILKRACFTKIFDKAYSGKGRGLKPREQYLLNMVFAIGCSHGFIHEQDKDKAIGAPSVGSNKSESNVSPEEYYSRACSYFDQCIMREKSLEVLQAILLLASFSLLRPVSPGAWYITGIAMRMAVDLGLHYDNDDTPDRAPNTTEHSQLDLANRDEHVETEETTQTELRESDIYATRRNCQEQASNVATRHQVIEKPSPRSKSPVQVDFDPESQWLWLESMEKRALDWKASAPTSHVTGVVFPKAIFEFYYWQTIMLLYQHDAKIPALIQQVKSVLYSLQVSSAPIPEADKFTQRRYVKMAEAAQKVLRMYRQRHLAGCIKYTYSSALYLFSVAISYLHAVAQSSAVRARLTADDVDFTILAAKSIFADMVDTCPDANVWMEALELTAKATTRITRLYDDLGQQSQQTDRKEGDITFTERSVTSAASGSSPNAKGRGPEDEAHMLQTLGGSSYSSPRENTKDWDSADETRAFRLGGADNISAWEMPVPPFGSLGSSQAMSEIQGRRGDIVSDDIFDLETIWQLDNLAAEAPHIYRVLNFSASAVETD
ncbi:positive regulator of purine utilization [Metarhizium acridum CQMa 102]|uniref:Positive regulator of purine utilization n=1 Tax=Metarhizium acridum (strain CQMa 102) TaxID=655827 RepID=E9DZ49_METAQ|nr:positive regulator of purine utilization [Metarhizium acridum CQMa 102]EFY91011.1 positive regulator of purine utilization [Metarhizium acridum CQMa 102]